MFQGAKNIYHLYTSMLANAWLRFPSRKLTVIGVTGTDGKTTTVNLIYHILKTAGFHTSMISTVGAILDNKTFNVGFHVTTPTGFQMQKFMKQALGGGVDKRYMVLEVSSHGLDQNRVWGIPFSIGVITNVTHEHLDYHRTYKNYVNTKCKLLLRSKTAVINKDDESYGLINSKLKMQSSKLSISQAQDLMFIKRQSKKRKIITYGLHSDSDINPKVFPFKSNLLGSYNQYNILAAVTVAKELGIQDKIIKDAIKTFSPPIGRGEIVYDKDFTVMIDFAHTPNAFAQVLPAVKPLVKGRLIHVFGSAARRDVTKRPIMGKHSGNYADTIILTSEDPRDEDPYHIMSDIEEGIENGKYKVIEHTDFQYKGSPIKPEKYIFEIPDRQEAINFAIHIAQPGDFILLTGKAHEKSMNYGKGEEPWDEYEAVKKALKKRNNI